MKYKKLPCLDYEIESEEFLKDSEIKEFFEEIKYELDCIMYLDEDYQMDQLAYGNSNVNSGELIDLFEFFTNAIDDEIKSVK